MNDLTPGTVYLVGGGPGDPDLITVGGLKAVQQADVLLVDHLAPQEVLAEARPDAEVINVGKWPYGHRTTQEEINELCVTHARAGRRVVRLKGGDPYVFGRGGEEYLYCAEAGVPVRVIPGVTSAVSVPALAGVPVTHRSLAQGFTVVSGHVGPTDPRSTLDWPALAHAHTSLVVLMGVAHLADIAEELVKGGLDPETPAVVIEEGASDHTRTVRGTLTDIAARAEAAQVHPPAITVIGAVAELSLA